MEKKQKIIVIVVVVVVIIAVIGFFMLQGEDKPPNGPNGPQNNPPTVEIIMTQDDFFVNQIIYFNCTATDLEGDELNYLWDFGDGETSTKSNTTHEYTIASTYNITLTVTDEYDNSGEANVTILVKDIPVVDLEVIDRSENFITGNPIYTVAVQSISQSISTELVHFYVIDGDTQGVLIDGNVADYVNPPPHEYVNFNDFDVDGNLSVNDNFVITGDPLSPTGETKPINDGDIFKLTMEGSDDLLGDVTLG